MLDARAHIPQLQLASMLILCGAQAKLVPSDPSRYMYKLPQGPLSAITLTLTKPPAISPLCCGLLLFAISIGSRSIRHAFDVDTLSLRFSGFCFGFRGSLLVFLSLESSFFLCLSPRLFVLSLIFFAQCFGFELVPVAIQIR